VQQCVPRATAHANDWALTVWRQWANYRNQLQETRRDNYFPIPVEFSEGSQVTVQKLDYWISFFVLEIRRQDGQCYPPNSLFNIVAGIQRHLRSLVNFCDIAFFNKSSPFLRLRKALDCRMKELTASGIGGVC